MNAEIAEIIERNLRQLVSISYDDGSPTSAHERIDLLVETVEILFNQIIEEGGK